MSEITFVIPCGGRKASRPVPACELYTGSMFRHTLAAVTVQVRLCEADGVPARILILSALHGLLEPGTVTAPYDLRLGQPGSVTPETVTDQAVMLGIGRDQEVRAFLPRAYLRLLRRALGPLEVPVRDVYEGTGGIGEQRHVNAVLAAEEQARQAASTA